jgi:hypothetical protein
MQSFNLFVVFAVLLINTQVNCGSFVCPVPGQPADQKDAYCIRRITRKELRDPANKNATMFSKCGGALNLSISHELMISCRPKPQ